MFIFHVTLSPPNDKKMKVTANNWAKIMHSEEALSVDFYRYDTKT